MELFSPSAFSGILRKLLRAVGSIYKERFLKLSVDSRFLFSTFFLSIIFLWKIDIFYCLILCIFKILLHIGLSKDSKEFVAKQDPSVELFDR